jgi:hypothetical protein
MNLTWLAEIKKEKLDGFNAATGKFGKNRPKLSKYHREKILFESNLGRLETDLLDHWNYRRLDKKFTLV